MRRARRSQDGAATPLSWIGSERVAISDVRSAWLTAHLADQGITHIVNCRSRVQVYWSGDLAAERSAFGPGRVAHAPLYDHGLPQRPARWSAAAALILTYRTEAELVPAYIRSVERWLSRG